MSEPDEDTPDLTAKDEDKVEDREATSARVVYEVIRREGDEELERPPASLAWSGLAGGIAISTSIFAQALLEDILPDAPWRPAVASFGYTLGFVIVVMGRLQLFTESTLLGVIPVVAAPTRANLGKLLRLWTIVLAANMVGTFVVALLFRFGLLGIPAHHDAMLTLSRHLLDRDAADIFQGAVLSGFLMAAVAWTLPAGRGQELWIVVILTYFIALGGLAHVVAGSGEVWLLWLAGDIGGGEAFGRFLLPALGGNIVGGTLIFALLAHAQVKDEV